MAKRRSSTKAISPQFDEAKYRREQDLRTLREADEIRQDAARLRAAKQEAKAQVKALARVTK